MVVRCRCSAHGRSARRKAACGFASSRRRGRTVRGGAAKANPFLIGADATARYYGILHHCLQAAQTRIAAAKPAEVPKPG